MNDRRNARGRQPLDMSFLFGGNGAPGYDSDVEGCPGCPGCSGEARKVSLQILAVPIPYAEREASPFGLLSALTRFAAALSGHGGDLYTAASRIAQLLPYVSSYTPAQLSGDPALKTLGLEIRSAQRLVKNRAKSAGDDASYLYEAVTAAAEQAIRELEAYETYTPERDTRTAAVISLQTSGRPDDVEELAAVFRERGLRAYFEAYFDKAAQNGFVPAFEEGEYRLKHQNGTIVSLGDMPRIEDDGVRDLFAERFPNPQARDDGFSSNGGNRHRSQRV